jgi:hypothetical protein
MEISNLKGLEKGKGKGDSSSHIVRIFQEEVDASLTWEFVSWMREVTDLPVFVKVGSSVLPRCLYMCRNHHQCLCWVLSEQTVS